MNTSLATMRAGVDGTPPDSRLDPTSSKLPPPRRVLLDDEAGRVIVAENTAHFPMRVEWDCIPDVSGFVSSRGLFMCQDVLPPRSRQLLVALSVDMRVKLTRSATGRPPKSHLASQLPSRFF